MAQAHDARRCQVGWPPVFHFVGTGDVVLVVLALAGQTNFATTLDLSLPTSGDNPYCGIMMGRRDGSSWLHDDDDDDELDGLVSSASAV